VVLKMNVIDRCESSTVRRIKEISMGQRRVYILIILFLCTKAGWSDLYPSCLFKDNFACNDAI
jgi:hypothetical protein